jgi:hypothetical protein
MDAMPSRILCCILPLLTLVAGCSLFSGDTSTSSTDTEPAPYAKPAPALTAAPPAADAGTSDSMSPGALAAKVAAYQQTLQGQPVHNPDNPPAAADAPATQPAATAIGDADWLTPDAIRLTTYKQDASSAPQRSAAPIAQPPKDSTAVASGNVSFPVSIPEGADTAPPASGDQAVPASAAESPTYTADEVERKLAAQVRDYPQDLEGQLDYELLLFIEGQPVPQMSALSGLRDEDRELLSAVMDGLSNFRSVVRSDNNQLLATKTQPLIDMADRLRSQSELTLPTVALCTSVSGFGLYTPVDKSRFPAGADNKVVVYCEVRNFQSTPTPDNHWQTQLTEEMVLYTESGLPVWPAKSLPQRVTDVCRAKRLDFCFAKLISLPSNLTIGRYLLKITVTDAQANHVAEASTPIEIVAE